MYGDIEAKALRLFLERYEIYRRGGKEFNLAVLYAAADARFFMDTARRIANGR